MMRLVRVAVESKKQAEIPRKELARFFFVHPSTQTVILRASIMRDCKCSFAASALSLSNWLSFAEPKTQMPGNPKCKITS